MQPRLYRARPPRDAACPDLMFRSRTALHSFALWLALSAVVLRSLIPVGFMPGWTGSGVEAGNRWLIICPASPLSAALAAPVAAHSGHGHHDHAAMLAAMAATDAGANASAAGAADPHAGHANHQGMQHGADAMAAAGPPVLVDVNAGHAGHDPAQHEAHRIASEHQSCPFAGAVAPALPVTTAGFALALPAARIGRPEAAATVATASQRRLPPARGPPDIVDTLAA